jgi:hypothetical protein
MSFSNWFGRSTESQQGNNDEESSVFSTLEVLNNEAVFPKILQNLTLKDQARLGMTCKQFHTNVSNFWERRLGNLKSITITFFVQNYDIQTNTPEAKELIKNYIQENDLNPLFANHHKSLYRSENFMIGSRGINYHFLVRTFNDIKIDRAGVITFMGDVAVLFFNDEEELKMLNTHCDKLKQRAGKTYIILVGPNQNDHTQLNDSVHYTTLSKLPSLLREIGPKVVAHRKPPEAQQKACTSENGTCFIM